MVNIDSGQPLRMDNLISPSGGHSRFDETPKEVYEVQAEIVRFDEKNVWCNVKLNEDVSEERKFDLKPLFAGWALFVGMKVGLTIKQGAGWVQCSASYVPSIDNAIITVS